MENNLIYKDNKLITALYSLSLSEQQLLLLLISKIKSDEIMFQKYTISIDEYSETFNIKLKKARHQLLNFTEKFNKTLKIKDNETTEKTEIKWLSMIEYDFEENQMSVEFSTDINLYLSSLKNKFTKYRLINIINLQSKYAIRLYELLAKQQNKTDKTFKISVTELKELLNVETKYKSFSHFHDKIIKPAIIQINEHSNFIVEYNTLKKSRSITSIKFKFNIKKTKKVSKKISNEDKELNSKLELTDDEYHIIETKKYKRKLNQEFINMDLDKKAEQIHLMYISKTRFLQNPGEPIPRLL